MMCESDGFRMATCPSSADDPESEGRTSRPRETQRKLWQEQRRAVCMATVAVVGRCMYFHTDGSYRITEAPAEDILEVPSVQELEGLIAPVSSNHCKRY